MGLKRMQNCLSVETVFMAKFKTHHFQTHKVPVSLSYCKISSMASEIIFMNRSVSIGTEDITGGEDMMNDEGLFIGWGSVRFEFATVGNCGLQPDCNCL